MNERVRLRDEIWKVESSTHAEERTLYRLRSDETGHRLTAIAPPDSVEILADGPLEFDPRALSPFGPWQLRHELIDLTSVRNGLAAIHGGRVQLEPYQLVPVAKILNAPSRNLLIADDVGLGKTVEAGLCIVELNARGVGKRVLLVVPPGLIDQWLEEMHGKFGLTFRSLADSASLDQAQTDLAEGISPWGFHDHVITSVEYLKRPGVYSAALRKPWDIIIVDEAHYLAESGSPANPYATRRTHLGTELRKATRCLLLLTATPHNGYLHSFRSLLELIEPTDAALAGDATAVHRRVNRAMVRRLKQQITKTGPDGSRVPAFIPRAPVRRLEVHCESDEEREIFRLVAEYCTRTAAAASGSDEQDVVSFAMQIVKKRMLSSRLALSRTIANRLEALNQAANDLPPTRADLRDLQGDLPLPEQQVARLSARVLRGSVPADARRLSAEKRRLRTIKRALDLIAARPDPKITALLADLRANVLAAPGEKAIVFTEYLDTLEALHAALDADPEWTDRIAELHGGLTPAQRRERIATFEAEPCRVLLATDAASEGLNLQQFCHRLYHVELPWNPNRLEQRNGRIDRYGQRRTSEIAYLFYADSPEDRVLDRLVARIGHMQGDRVSTPDIVGIVEATRLPDRLLAMTPEDDGNAVASSLVRVFDEEHGDFLRDVAPVLAAGDIGEDESDATSADPMLGDDLSLEVAMLRILGGAAKPGGGPHEYSVSVPIHLQGQGVAPRYPALTFRRSVAVADGSNSAEFAHRLHPLVRAAAAHARARLTLSAHGVTLPPYLAVRRLPGTMTAPAAVFTFIDRGAPPDGALVAVGMTVAGDELPDEIVARALEASARPGDVPWEECVRAFGTTFSSLRKAALDAALAVLRSRTADEQTRRARLAAEFREEAEAYRADRARELDRQEALERHGAGEQAELFRETRTDWAARRAAVATQAGARLEQIHQWETIPDPTSPEPLGVLLLFPEADV